LVTSVEVVDRSWVEPIRRVTLAADMLGVIVTGHPDLVRRGARHRQDLGEGSPSRGRPVGGRSPRRVLVARPLVSGEGDG